MTPQRFDPKGRWKMCKKNSVFSTAKPQTLLQLTSIWKSLQISPAIPHLVFEMLLFFFECHHWPWQKSPHTQKKAFAWSFHPSFTKVDGCIVFSKKRRLQGFKDVFVWGFWGSKLTSRHLDFFNQGSLGVAWEVLVTNIGRLQWRNLKWFFLAPLSQKQNKKKLVWSSAFESFMRTCDANSDPPVPPVCSKKEGLNSMIGKLVGHVWGRKMTGWSLTCWYRILWIKSQNKRQHNIGYCMTYCWWKKLFIYFFLLKNLRCFPWSRPSTVQFTHCWYSFKDRIRKACLIMNDCYYCQTINYSQRKTTHNIQSY